MIAAAHVSLEGEPWLAHRRPVLQLGLRRVAARAWLWRAADIGPWVANKRAVGAALGERALCALPGSGAAIAEWAAMLAAHSGSPPAAATPAEQLERASLGSAEDWCLLQRDPARGDWRLCAAHLCAPSHWALEDKIGRPLERIHAPVPGFASAPGPAVARLFERLPADRVLERFNWSLDECATLCARPPAPGRRQGRAPRRWYRAERQTLRRLPHSGAVVFSILVRHWPLAWLAARGERASIEAAIAALPAPLASYKGLADGVAIDWG